MAMTPMMKQWKRVKEENPGVLVFFRLGDFYEMFYDDAIIASKVLEITLTGRDCGMEERAPMCGVPYHSVDNYLKKLLSAGYKVAICEQMEDPALAKGIVKRDVIRIITPGTIVEPEFLDANDNNYIISLYVEGSTVGIAVSDISTGEFFVEEMDVGGLNDLFYKYQPKECVVNAPIKLHQEIPLNVLKAEYYEENTVKDCIGNQFGSEKDFVDMPLAKKAAGSLLQYFYNTQKRALYHIREVVTVNEQKYMGLDEMVQKNLELTQNFADGKKKGSLYGVLDKTVTAIGARMMKKWILNPLTDIGAIQNRLDAVEESVDNTIFRLSLRDILKNFYDMERIISKVCYQTANARDLISLKNSIGLLPEVKRYLQTVKADLYQKYVADFDTLDDLYALLDKAVNEEAPLVLREGYLIKDHYNADVDEYRNILKNGKQWIIDLEAKEREETGIKFLKVKFNKVFGYFIEVTKSNVNMVPEDRYIRKQTTVNGERYITEELKTFETKLLGAEEKVKSLEYELFVEIRNRVMNETNRIQPMAKMIGELDAILSLGEVAVDNNYVRPEVNGSNVIDIADGRHPVIERLLKDDIFIPNDLYIDTATNNLFIITGPNMAGKSTYMRQLALIVIMAQMGSFVPARKASVGVADQIFTRIGASDNLSQGQSTFMVEMMEVAHLLKKATPKSIVILDEVGRGTSTFDGLSIAWATLEYIQEHVKARTLFATHYHELIDLENYMDGVKNYRVIVKEDKGEVEFLHRIVPGGTSKSYGIHVAKLAGLPEELINRAELILNKVEKNSKISLTQGESLYPETEEDYIPKEKEQPLSKEYQKIMDELYTIDLYSITPIESMSILNHLIIEAKKIKEGRSE